MSRSIHFNGIEYANEEAMPPEVRTAFEQYRAEARQIIPTELADSASRAVPPAWGGPRAAGAVPVPVEFDPVTMLGPASAVHEHDGIRVLPSFGPPHANALVVYRDGFAFQVGKDIHPWRWEEVAVIQSSVWMTGSSHAVYVKHEYTLTRGNGDKVVLDDGLKTIQDALDPIKKNVAAHLLPPLAQQYHAGQALTFGPVTIHQQNGLQLDGRPYAWAAIRDLTVDRGRLTMTLRDGKKHEARASAIPNIEILGQLIGLTFYEIALAYY